MTKLQNLDDTGIEYGLYARFFKRGLDFAISLLALIVLSPIFLLLCLLIRVKLGSPIFFKQTRAGRDEKPFDMIKFRTMSDARDESGELLPDTDRFTKFGDFLRNYSLDELPELLNVLKGDMSIIGPRPLYTFYIPFYTEEEALRHVVRGGITGLAQVNGRALCRWNERFAYDVEYVRNITFVNDIKILLQTVYKVFKKSDIGVPSVTDEGGLHIIRDVQRPDRIKEIGSTFSGKIGEESVTKVPFGNINGNTIFLSTGRSCIREILKRLDVKRKVAIVPSFTCESVIQPFLDAGYEIHPYQLKSNLSIDSVAMEALIADNNPSILIFHRYFGFNTCEGLEKLLYKYPSLITIEDETQYMFTEHQDSWATYRIGSIRKWGPFPDGAYLSSKAVQFHQPWVEDTEFIKIEVDAMNAKQAYLDKETEDKSYQKLFAKGREYIDAQKETYSMSAISKAIVASFNLVALKRSRRTNAGILIDGLKRKKWFTLPIDSIPNGVTPFMIPIFVHRNRMELQKYLASQRIYATIIWACPDELKDLISTSDQQIYNEILCIPCDQRYDSADMQRIVFAVNRFEKKHL